MAHQNRKGLSQFTCSGLLDFLPVSNESAWMNSLASQAQFHKAYPHTCPDHSQFRDHIFDPAMMEPMHNVIFFRGTQKDNYKDCKHRLYNPMFACALEKASGSSKFHVLPSYTFETLYYGNARIVKISLGQACGKHVSVLSTPL